MFLKRVMQKMVAVVGGIAILLSILAIAVMSASASRPQA